MALFSRHETEVLLTELQARKHSAWIAYARALDGLEGAGYEPVERDAWAALQAELRTVEAERCEVLAFTA